MTNRPTADRVHRWPRGHDPLPPEAVENIEHAADTLGLTGSERVAWIDQQRVAYLRRQAADARALLLETVDVLVEDGWLSLRQAAIAAGMSWGGLRGALQTHRQQTTHLEDE